MKVNENKPMMRMRIIEKEDRAVKRMGAFE
jgi:hypothetical protein